MKAIRTRYHGPADVKGSRYSATDGDGNRVMLGIDHALSSEANHKRAAMALMAKMNWPNALLGGGFGSDMYWVMDPKVGG